MAGKFYTCILRRILFFAFAEKLGELLHPAGIHLIVSVITSDHVCDSVIILNICAVIKVGLAVVLGCIGFSISSRTDLSMTWMFSYRLFRILHRNQCLSFGPMGSLRVSVK